MAARRRFPLIAACALGAFGALAMHGAPSRGQDAAAPPAEPRPRAPTAPPARTTDLAKAQAQTARVAELSAAGRADEAVAAAREAVALWEHAVGPDDVGVADGLSTLCTLLSVRGAYGDARPSCERAVAIVERTLGPAHREVASALGNLAEVLLASGAVDEAQPLFQRALAIREAGLGRDAPEVAASLTQLAACLRARGETADAQPLLERALAIRTKALRPDDPLIAGALNNLASVLQDLGALDEAAPLYERAVGVLERGLSPDHPYVARALGNLASLRCAQGDYAAARTLYERALAIRERSLGAEHVDVARSLDELAAVLVAQGAPAEARPLYARAIALWERELGPDHPEVTRAAAALGTVEGAGGALDAAGALLERALAADLETFGPGHLRVARTANRLAVLRAAQGRDAEARAAFRRALDATDLALRGHLAGLSSPQRLALVRTLRFQLDDWIDFAPRVGATGYEEVLRFKGLLARAETAERILARRGGASAATPVRALRTAERRLAALANAVPGLDRDARARWQREYSRAAAECELQSLALAAAVAPYRAGLERLDLRVADVAAALDDDEALIDYLRSHDRYVAWIVRRGTPPARVDLGPAASIDAAAAAFADRTGDDDTTTDDPAWRDAGRRVRELVVAPVVARLPVGVARVVLCPDAALASVPFDALPGREAGSFVVDDLEVAYVAAAQDVVRTPPAPDAGRGALLVGDPTYGRIATPDAAGRAPTPDAPEGPGPVTRGGRVRAFPPLPETRAEVLALARRLGPDVHVLLGDDATATRVRRAAPGNAVIHLATHGFVRDDPRAGLWERRIEEAWAGADVERQLAVGRDPMLQAGLAFAGANVRVDADEDDGLLTALEVSYLDLDGVDLVTLSACASARGATEPGEGVIGLVRAFRMAGAAHVVASLWAVDDEASRVFMERFYELARAPTAPARPAAAAREAARTLRTMRSRDGRAFAAPRFWAPYVAYGR